MVPSSETFLVTDYNKKTLPGTVQSLNFKYPVFWFFPAVAMYLHNILNHTGIMMMIFLFWSDPTNYFLMVIILYLM